MKWHCLTAVLCVVAAVCAGCATAAKQSGDASAAIQFLDITTPPGSVNLADILADLPNSQTYRVVAGDDVGATVNRVRSETDNHGAHHVESEDDRRETFFRRENDGRLLMTAVIENADKAISVFNPPLLFAPVSLTPGSEQTSESDMKVVERDEPTKRKESGRATRTIKYVGDQRIRTAQGEFETHRIELHFTADLRLADADETTTLYIAPGVGVLVEESIETVKVLGTFGRTRRRTLLLSP